MKKTKIRKENQKATNKKMIGGRMREEIKQKCKESQKAIEK